MAFEPSEWENNPNPPCPDLWESEVEPAGVLLGPDGEPLFYLYDRDPHRPFGLARGNNL